MTDDIRQKRRSKTPPSSKAPPSCLDKALHLLGFRDHTEAELAQKLTRAGYPKAEIESACTRLREMGYLDDARFAARAAESLHLGGKLGRRSALQKLVRKGISPKAAEAAIEAAFHDSDEAEKALSLVRTRFPALTRNSPPGEKARAARFLAYRGFEMSAIAQVLRMDAAFEDCDS